MIGSRSSLRDWDTPTPTNLAGIHITLLAIPRERPGGHQPTGEEDRFYAQLDHWLKEECGYSWIMGTKPQTLAYALTDSPVGLAAWVWKNSTRERLQR